MDTRTARRLRVVVAAGAAATMLASCSSGGGQGETSAPAAPGATTTAAESAITGAAADSVIPWAASGQAPDTTITVCFFSGPEFDTIQQHAPEFTDLTGGKIKVNMVSIPIDQALPVTVNQLRTSSECDLVDGASEHASDVNPYLLPLDDYVADPTLLNPDVYDMNDIPQGVRDVASSDQGLMSLPFYADVQMIFYRKDLLDSWGITVPTPPEAWTWQQLEAALQTMQQKITEGGLDMSPVAVTGTQDASSAMFALTSMWSWGGSPFDGNDPNFTDPKAVEGFTHWSGLLNDLKVASPGSPTYAYNELLTALQQGNAAMIFEWNAAATDLNDPAKSPITAGKLGYAILPYDESLPADTPRVFPTTHTLGINAKSEHPKEAFEFAAWFTSPDMGRTLAEERSAGSRTSILTDPTLLEKKPALAAVAASGALYHAMPNIPSFGDLLTNVIAPSVNATFTGQRSADQAMQDIQTGAENLLAKAGK